MKKNKIVSRAAMTFIEILLAVFILAMTMLPILQFLGRSTGGSKEDRTQAAAAAYAAKLMNQYLYELSWTNVNDGGISGTGTLADDTKTGVEFKWTGKVLDAWPIGNQMAVKRTTYHNGCSGACSQGTEDLPRRSPQTINPNFCNRANVGGIVFKTVILTFQWKGPGDSGYIDTHKQVLVVRRGMLEEANF